MWPKEFIPITESFASELHIDIVKAFLSVEEKVFCPIAIHPHISLKTISDKKHPCYSQRGIFATKKIEKNEPIGEYLGEYKLVSRDKISSFDFSYAVTLKEVGRFLVIVDAKKYASEMAFINDYHGIKDHPNVTMIGIPHKGYLTPIVVAKTSIEEGEELLADYGSGYWQDKKVR